MQFLSLLRKFYLFIINVFLNKKHQFLPITLILYNVSCKCKYKSISLIYVVTEDTTTIS